MNISAWLNRHLQTHVATLKANIHGGTWDSWRTIFHCEFFFFWLSWGGNKKAQHKLFMHIANVSGFCRFGFWWILCFLFSSTRERGSLDRHWWKGRSYGLSAIIRNKRQLNLGTSIVLWAAAWIAMFPRSSMKLFFFIWIPCSGTLPRQPPILLVLDEHCFPLP